MTDWYTSPVLHGDKAGRKISFPTINLEPSIWPPNQEPGVYSSQVKIGSHSFTGALYFGPRTVKNEIHNVLEIYLLDFSREIYGQTVSFRLHQFIRPVIHFNSFEEMKPQIAKDVKEVLASFNKLEKSDES